MLSINRARRSRNPRHCFSTTNIRIISVMARKYLINYIMKDHFQLVYFQVHPPSYFA